MSEHGLSEAECDYLRLSWPHSQDGSIACRCLDCQLPLLKAVEHILADRLAAVVAERDEALAEVARLRGALGFTPRLPDDLPTSHRREDWDE